MSLKDLLDKLKEEGKIKDQSTDIEYLNGLLSSAYENLRSAQYNIKGDFHETAFKSAYDGLLQISRVILLINGHRTINGEQHKTTFLVAGAILGNDFKDLIKRIDRYRIKRNNVVYRPVDLLSKAEAEGILEAAEEYWGKVKDYLHKQSNQLKLFDL